MYVVDDIEKGNNIEFLWSYIVSISLLKMVENWKN